MFSFSGELFYQIPRVAANIQMALSGANKIVSDTGLEQEKSSQQLELPLNQQNIISVYFKRLKEDAKTKTHIILT